VRNRTVVCVQIPICRLVGTGSLLGAWGLEALILARGLTPADVLDAGSDTEKNEDGRDDHDENLAHCSLPLNRQMHGEQAGFPERGNCKLLIRWEKAEFVTGKSVGKWRQ
jgi:hypothetical protein